MRPVHGTAASTLSHILHIFMRGPASVASEACHHHQTHALQATKSPPRTSEQDPSAPLPASRDQRDIKGSCSSIPPAPSRTRSSMGAARMVVRVVVEGPAASPCTVAETWLPSRPSPLKEHKKDFFELFHSYDAVNRSKLFFWNSGF